MRGPGWLNEAACTATAMTMCCVLLCGGMLILTGLAWFLNAVGANVLIMPVIGIGMLANMVLSFILAGKLARWLMPRADLLPRGGANPAVRSGLDERVEFARESLE